jgi:hypothetical protein
MNKITQVARIQREKSMESLLNIHPRHMRSVHLEGDFADTTSSLGFVLTPVAADALSRISSAFRSDSTQRAFRISGDYGSGKSAFGLALARISAGNTRALPKALHPFCQRIRVQPRLATGDHEPLGVTVLRALGCKVSRGTKPTTDEVLLKVKKSIGQARSNGYKGVLLVLDELGKNLEFAAQNPEFDDIFLLQRLAEEATRSGDQPLILVVMLHQGVAAYSAGLDSAARREWDKVAGRLEEILYTHPLEQFVTLVAATLSVNLKALPREVAADCTKAMLGAVRSGLYGSSAALELSRFGPAIFPFHPTVLPVLVRTIRKFGQNERSLFSFISASEPMGLQHHIQLIGSKLIPYRLHHLFDYVKQNLSPSIHMGNSYLHWGYVDSLLASTPLDNIEEESVFKCIALLNLLDAPDLPATQEFLHLALDNGTNQRAISKAIKEMKNRSVLYERGTVRGLCLWPHTSVNLDEEFKRGSLATQSGEDSIGLLCRQLPPEQIVPRGHYLRSGTLRYGEVQFVPATGLPQLLKNQPELSGKGPDLNLRVILPANQVQFRETEKQLRAYRESLSKGLYIAIAQPPTSSAAALSDLSTWKWVQTNTPALAGDRYAREEVARQVARAERRFRERLGGLDSLELPIAPPMTWFSLSREVRLKSGRELLGFLSDQCDQIYSKSPHVLNELINRRSPSSAAVAARTKLVEAMATAPNKPMLDMDDSKRPPEMALYLSILQKGGLHQETKDGWKFQLPSEEQDHCRLLPSLNHITDLLKESGTDALVPVLRIFDGLSQIPFGIREGLQPFILAIYLSTHHQRVALYEDGTYLPEVGGEVFLRLMKEPQFFHIQYCEVDSVRADVFTRLLELLKIHPRDASRADLIDLVRPLTIFISREVPEYSRKTNSLPATAVAVRRALLEARDPVKLVFTMIPEACGLAPIGEAGLKTPEELAARLRIALHEIRTAYPMLVARLGDAICAAFDVDSALPAGRSLIAARAAQLSVVVTAPALKAFVMRLADNALSDKAWVESIANLLARKSSERWIDNDETEFHHQLGIAAGRFKRTELASIGTTKRLNGHALRIAITKSDGTEVGDLMNWEGMDENRIHPVETQIHQILAQHGRHGLAAAMRAIWTQLDAEGKSRES